MRVVRIRQARLYLLCLRLCFEPVTSCFDRARPDYRACRARHRMDCDRRCITYGIAEALRLAEKQNVCMTQEDDASVSRKPTASSSSSKVCLNPFAPLRSRPSVECRSARSSHRPSAEISGLARTIHGLGWGLGSSAAAAHAAVFGRLNARGRAGARCQGSAAARQRACAAWWCMRHVHCGARTERGACTLRARSIRRGVIDVGVQSAEALLR